MPKMVPLVLVLAAGAIAAVLLMGRLAFMDYSHRVVETKERMRSTGESVVWGAMNERDARQAIMQTGVREDDVVFEGSTVTAKYIIDSSQNVGDHAVYLQVRFINHQARQFRVWDSAGAL
ncbi:MAG: hypothetical protein M3R13_07215 [Armatimonadota bacterium]|nr:hypothetical protein [Armatimonadota bacterium]